MCLAWQEMVAAGEGVVPTSVVVPGRICDVQNTAVSVGAPSSCGHGSVKARGSEQVKVKVMEMSCGN